jgi:isocitrate dehydrogenase (NAD+)
MHPSAEPLTVVRIAGDGVGPELVAAGSQVVEETGLDVCWVDLPAGAGAYERHGSTAPAQTLAAIRAHGAAIKGPVYTPSGGTVRSANYYLRRELDLYACLRPLPVLPDTPPVLLVRENVEDLYGAIEWMAGDAAHAVKVATRAGCERIARYAFELAQREGRRTVTLVHKANNLKVTEGLFLAVTTEVAREYPAVRLTDMLMDTAAATLVLSPGTFDVVLTSNTFGDILSGVGAAVAGSLGLVGSLNSGDGIHVAEAGHGDAGQLAGLDRVNPIAFFEGVALLLQALGRSTEAGCVARALAQQRQAGPSTLDMGGTARTSDVTRQVCELIAADRAGG